MNIEMLCFYTKMWTSVSFSPFTVNEFCAALGGSGHDLPVLEFDPNVGLCADSSEPGACFRFCVPLSLWPSPAHTLSLSQNKTKKDLSWKPCPKALCIHLFDHSLQGLNNKISYLGYCFQDESGLVWKDRQTDWLIG